MLSDPFTKICQSGCHMKSSWCRIVLVVNSVMSCYRCNPAVNHFHYVYKQQCKSCLRSNSYPYFCLDFWIMQEWYYNVLSKHVHVRGAKGITVNIDFFTGRMLILYCIRHMTMVLPTRSTRIVPLPFFFNYYFTDYNVY